MGNVPRRHKHLPVYQIIQTYVHTGRPVVPALACGGYVQVDRGGCQLPDYSGRTLIRLGRAANRSFLISVAVTLQDSRYRDRRFCRGFRWWRPALDTREFDRFSVTSAVRPITRT